MLRKFIQYYKPHRRLFAVDITCAAMIALIDLFIPRMTEQLIDVILPQNSTRVLVMFCGVFAVLYIIRAGFQYIVEYYGHLLGVKMEFDMRNKLFDHIQTLPISFFDNYKVGKLMSRLVNDLNEIAEVAHHGPEDLLISVVFLIGSFIMMFISNATLAFALLCVIPFLFYFGVSKNIKFKATFRALKQQLGNINARSEDNFSGIRVVKAFANEEYEVETFTKGNKEFFDAKDDSYKVMAEFGVTVKTLIHFIQLLVFLVGGYLIIQNELTIGELTAFMLYVQLFQTPINKISGFIMQYNQAIAGFERFDQILMIPSQEGGTRQCPTPFEGKIIFDDVSFQYDHDLPFVLKDINLVIEPSKSVAIVGHSGGGKSTLSSLVPRFYECTKGSITIDGIDIREFDLKELRKHIGIVQQDVFIFAGSVKENIAYGLIGASLSDIEDAARKANALGFIEELPQGFDTYLGERGVKLSGGQKQRIAIARMFLKNPKILILDEATSALDNESEVLIQNALANLTKERTTIVIAHRLSTIVNSDEIIVVEDGEIIERGTHDTLLEVKGAYHNLHQAGLHKLDFEEMSRI